MKNRRGRRDTGRKTFYLPFDWQNDNAKSRFVSGIGKVGNDVKLLLDPAMLLGDEEAALVGHLNNEDERV